MSSDPDSDASFEEFVGARHGALRRTAYLLCGDWHFAEDLTQSALIKLYPKWARLRDPETAYGYARTILVRTFIDARRKHSSRELVRGEIPEVVARAHDADRRMALEHALDRLQPSYRAVLVLRYWEDQSTEQTAAALNMKVGTVRSVAHRGLARLREILGESLDEIASA